MLFSIKLESSFLLKSNFLNDLIFSNIIWSFWSENKIKNSVLFFFLSINSCINEKKVFNLCLFILSLSRKKINTNKLFDLHLIILIKKPKSSSSIVSLLYNNKFDNKGKFCVNE